MDTSPIAPTGRRRRRRHSAEFKSSVIRACMQPGVSIAAVALANGLNANMLRKWVIETERAGAAERSRPSSLPASSGAVEPVPGFIPVSMGSEPVPVDIRIELQRGATAVKVAWPASAASECAAWLRELLR